MKAKWKTVIGKFGTLTMRCLRCGVKVDEPSAMNCQCDPERVLLFGQAPASPQRHKYPCTGSVRSMSTPPMNYQQEQIDWMIANKPLYYTGQLRLDIVHLPSHLRHL